MKTLAALDLLLALIARAGTVSQMIKAAHAEGRDSLNKAETDQLVTENDAARDKLVAAIGRSEAKG